MQWLEEVAQYELIESLTNLTSVFTSHTSQVAAAYQDGSVALINVELRSQLHRFSAHGGSVQSLSTLSLPLLGEGQSALMGMTWQPGSARKEDPKLAVQQLEVALSPQGDWDAPVADAAPSSASRSRRRFLLVTSGDDGAVKVWTYSPPAVWGALGGKRTSAGSPPGTSIHGGDSDPLVAPQAEGPSTDSEEGGQRVPLSPRSLAHSDGGFRGTDWLSSPPSLSCTARVPIPAVSATAQSRGGGGGRGGARQHGGASAAAQRVWTASCILPVGLAAGGIAQDLIGLIGGRAAPGPYGPEGAAASTSSSAVATSLASPPSSGLWVAASTHSGAITVFQFLPGRNAPASTFVSRQVG